jgi:asparagine synthase
MTPAEIAFGWVAGGASGSVAVEPGVQRSPLEGLEAAILPALLRTPCVIEFSGGRDSSIVLAAACRVASREGLALPVPFTRRYDEFPEANEDEWQEMVIRHLGIGEWIRHHAVEEVDLLGPIATASLQRHGVVWPPLAHTRKTELELARGGSLLSGEGGDEVLGPRRLSILSLLMARKLPLSRSNLRKAALALSPAPVRAERYRRRFAQAAQFPWLTVQARERVAVMLAEDAAAEPMDWRKAVRRHPSVRPVRVAMETLDLLAADSDVARLNPLLSAQFLNALCRAGGALGYTDRTAALVELFGDLLPGAVLTRKTKSRFNRAVFGAHSREFASHWNGEGVDAELVDADVLREVWAAEEPHSMSFVLLHACWLAANA